MYINTNIPRKKSFLVFMLILSDGCREFWIYHLFKLFLIHNFLVKCEEDNRRSLLNNLEVLVVNEIQLQNISYLRGRKMQFTF